MTLRDATKPFRSGCRMLLRHGNGYREAAADRHQYKVWAMSDPLGLSIGTTNLVAARVGLPPVTRRSQLTLFSDRTPEVGVSSENATPPDAGTVIGGFVERLGDAIPLVAADGSTYHAEQLVADALDAMIYTVGGPAAQSEVAIAVPAHWGPGVLDALRGGLRTQPSLAPNGLTAQLISDAVAALSALNVDPGLPRRGVVALLDFGGSGTSITLADAGSNF